MANTIWAAAASLLGVLIGGALSVLAQGRADRSAARRFAATIREDRRVEKVTHLIDFLETVQEAERLAVSQRRLNRGGAKLTERIDAQLDRLWVKLRAVQLLCPRDVGKAAHDYAWQIHMALRQGTGGQQVAESLHSSRTELLDVARIDLGRVDVGGTMRAGGLA